MRLMAPIFVSLAAALALAPACGASTASGGTSTTGGASSGSSTGGGALDAGSGGTTGGCTPDCAGKGCGSDGCGHLCGACAVNQYCTARGECHASNIEHVVLIVQENHTFESYFGAYCQAGAGSNPTCTQGPSCCEGAPIVNGVYTDPSGSQAGALDDDSSNGDSNFATDRDHLQACELQQIDQGRMDRYVTGSNGPAMTCLGLGPDCSAQANWVLASGATPQSAIAYYWALASGSALADRYFQPIVGASASNDIYFADARFRFADNGALPTVSAGMSSGSLCAGGPCLAAPQAIYPADTIADLLLGAGFTFGIYADGFAEAAAVAGSCPSSASATECPYSDAVLHPAAHYGCLYDPSDIPFLFFQGFTDTAAGPTPYEKDLSALEQDLANGALPNFAFVKARLYHNEHPNMSTLADGVAFVSSTIDLIEQSAYKDHTLILLTWDEGGGFFDHVPPPAAPPTAVDADSSGNPVPYGTRVPFLAIGPFAKAGVVSHVPLEHSSIVKFLEFNFLGTEGGLGARDGWVNDLGSLLDPKAVGVTVP